MNRVWVLTIPREIMWHTCINIFIKKRKFPMLEILSLNTTSFEAISSRIDLCFYNNFPWATGRLPSFLLKPTSCFILCVIAMKSINVRHQLFPTGLTGFMGKHSTLSLGGLCNVIYDSRVQPGIKHFCEKAYFRIK